MVNEVDERIVIGALLTTRALYGAGRVGVEGIVTKSPTAKLFVAVVKVIVDPPAPVVELFVILLMATVESAELLEAAVTVAVAVPLLFAAVTDPV